MAYGAWPYASMSLHLSMGEHCLLESEEYLYTIVNYLFHILIIQFIVSSHFLKAPIGHSLLTGVISLVEQATLTEAISGDYFSNMM